MKLGLIGAGKMGMSILSGITNNGIFKKENITICVRREEKFKELKDEGYNVTYDPKEAYEKTDILVLAIKPQGFEEMLNILKDVKKNSLIISVAAGIKIEYINSYLKGRIVRVMPNTPATIGYGTTAISLFNTTDDDRVIVDQIFKSIGTVAYIDEKMMNDVTPCNGSMPAYVFYFIRAFVNSAVEAGFDLETAKKLVASSVLGSAKLLMESTKDLDTLISDVCSKGGTTIEGIYVFDNANLNKIIDDCFKACAKRAKELGEK